MLNIIFEKTTFYIDFFSNGLFFYQTKIYIIQKLKYAVFCTLRYSVRQPVVREKILVVYRKIKKLFVIVFY